MVERNTTYIKKQHVKLKRGRVYPIGSFLSNTPFKGLWDDSKSVTENLKNVSFNSIKDALPKKHVTEKELSLSESDKDVCRRLVAKYGDKYKMRGPVAVEREVWLRAVALGLYVADGTAPGGNALEEDVPENVSPVAGSVAVVVDSANMWPPDVARQADWLHQYWLAADAEWFKALNGLGVTRQSRHVHWMRYSKPLLGELLHATPKLTTPKNTTTQDGIRNGTLEGGTTLDGTTQEGTTQNDTWTLQMSPVDGIWEPLYLPTPGFTKRLTDRTGVFESDLEAHTKLRGLLTPEQWKRLKGIRLCDFDCCRLDYLELAAILCEFYHAPLGEINPSTHDFIVEKLGGLNALYRTACVDTRMLWVSACLLEHSQVDIDTLVRFCIHTLQFRPGRLDLECLRKAFARFEDYDCRPPLNENICTTRLSSHLHPVYVSAHTFGTVFRAVAHSKQAIYGNLLLHVRAEKAKAKADHGAMQPVAMQPVAMQPEAMIQQETGFLDEPQCPPRKKQKRTSRHYAKPCNKTTTKTATEIPRSKASRPEAPTTIALKPTTITLKPTTIAPKPMTIALKPTTIAPKPTTIAPKPVDPQSCVQIFKQFTCRR
ncbi:hypothetical protein GNI_089450 [Gregarina niphandrodes]|uniref:Uncharacterized protein n=1 Tax=Gregarina niphandrodes TaxID=110365 RepID=A0A023B5T0_GRENI|nr:hypothetical protein GNI_089450 [Gregarina niphandrodes]EZG61142.1 hypothetical protein GNI_089450 [Gregarina niphandrodes]|eukprot:XP_011130795.1 hypothetical protein GNI_089450 [Gregarina niphandrodes]